MRKWLSRFGAMLVYFCTATIIAQLIGVGLLLTGGNISPEASKRANDATAQDIDAYRDRLIGLATVDMNEPEAAAAELERCVKDLGFRGVEILSNVHGENLHEPRFAPFYRKVQELDVAVFIHPHDVLGRADRLKPFFLSNIVGNPTDTAVAAACLIFGGVLREMPRLRFVLAHGGGSCPLLRGRWLTFRYEVEYGMDERHIKVFSKRF